MVKVFNAWFWVFMLQAGLSLVNNASAMYVMLNSVPGEIVKRPYLVAGVLVWLIGHLCETVADN